MIKYRVIASKFSTNPDGYAARVLHYRTAELDEVVDRIVKRGTTVARPDVFNVLGHYYDVLEEMLLEGLRISTPAGEYRAGMSGTFTDEAAPFNPEHHHVVPRVAPGKRLRQALAGAQVERYLPDLAVPHPATFIDTATGKRNDVVTPGQIGRLVGKRLRFDPADARQGVFFLAEGGTTTRVDPVAWNKDRHLFFVVPPLAAGSYKVEVRVAYGDDDLRVGALEAPLRVVS